MLISRFLNVQRLLAIFCLLEPITSKPRDNAVFRDMEILTKKLGQSFFEFSNGVTKFKELRDRFSREGEIRDVNAEQLFANVMRTVNESLQGRLDAIQKLAAYAEPKAFDHYSALPPLDKRKTKRPIPKSYFNAKLINQPPPEDKDEEEEEDENKFNCTFPTDLPISKNEHFKSNVSMNVSSVHVPTSIYACDPELLEALVWSSDLEETFRDNYQQNPTLSWQYFGSSTGFMRQYPAMKWPNDNTDRNSPDLYDCRFRPWYTASATSPKNLLILLDVSGSMKGMRRRIAKAVVNSILDTLTENDFVNVFRFSEITEVIVGCMNDTGTPILVQATMENVRELRVALEHRETRGMANFTMALTKAFESLSANQKEDASSNCNQAVMLVTDGAPEYFKAFFDQINKQKKIRLFTYLVGKEVTDTAEMQWIACFNQGFFVQIFTLAEVQEKVFKYIPVMSRPLVMSQRREVMWTPVYASHADLIESEWLWEAKTRIKQEERSERYQWYYQNVAENNVKKGANKSAIFAFSDGKKKDDKNDVFILALHKLKTYLDYGYTNITYKSIRKIEAEKEREIKMIRDYQWGSRTIPSNSTKEKLLTPTLDKFKRQHFKDFDFKKFNFVVSASYPVFDMRNFTNSSSKERIANFLGVVGTDVSIDELKDLTSPFELGVNAYAFAITNNGHIIFHPDFRPLYENILENILKPTYNSVDITEVELIDRDGDYLDRNNDEQLLELRKLMIDKIGPEPMSYPRVVPVRIHRDGFKRVTTKSAVYVFGKIPGTLYTLAIQVPQNSTAYDAEIEVNLLHRGANIVTSFFETDINDSHETVRALFRNWKLHPDWTYCHYLTPHPENLEANTKEDIFLHFIKRIQLQKFEKNMSWAWGSMAYGSGKVDREKRDDDSQYICDKKLVQSVIFDAMITKPLGDSSKILETETIKRIVTSFGAELLNTGALTTFIATRSGLTRWIDHPQARTHPTDLPFTHYYARTIEESWYQRSVERAAVEEDSYVVSVSFDAGTRNYSRVTATRAIIATRNGKKAPVAVVGVQYDLDSFLSFFGFAFGSGPDRLKEDKRNLCQDEDFHCFILDENAFVIGSSISRDDAGSFFGEIDNMAMDALINSTIYKEVRIVDFQAVCSHPIIRTSFANILTNPFRQVSVLFNWFIGYMVSFLLRLNFPLIIRSPFVFTEEPEYDDDEDLSGDRNMPFVEYASVSKTKLRPCDVEYKLFMYGDGYSVDRRTLDRRARLMCNQNCDDYLNVQRIPYTNLIMVIIEAKCHRCFGRGYRYRKTIDGREVEYPIYTKFVNKTQDNPILLELCRTPQRPLYRKRLSHCHSYAKDEFKMKEDCGGAFLSKGSWTATLVATVFATQFKQILTLT